MGTPRTIYKQQLPALSWGATVPFPTAAAVGWGRTVARDVVAASLTTPGFWAPPPPARTLTVRLLTAVGLFEQPLFKPDWNVMQYVKSSGF